MWDESLQLGGVRPQEAGRRGRWAQCGQKYMDNDVRASCHEFGGMSSCLSNSTNSRYTRNSRLFLCGWTWPQPAAVLDNLVLEVSSRLAGDSSRKCRVVTEVIVVTTQAKFDIVATSCSYSVGWCSQAQKYFFPIGLNVKDSAIEMIFFFFSFNTLT